MLEDIGIGNRVAYLTARQLVPEMDEQQAHSKNNDHTPQETVTKALTISGTEGMVVTYAKCCHPLPGDAITGHLSAGKGVVVHCTDCINTAKIREEKGELIALRWDENVKGEFLVPISVAIKHQRGMIATLATKINSLDANIESINAKDVDAYSSQVDIEVSVHDRIHLARIMRHIRNIKSVTRIHRVRALSYKRNFL